MLRWQVLGCLALFFCISDAQAGFGLYNVVTKTGLDVVQSNDARRFYVLQADVATVFTPRLRLEVGAEFGQGQALDETNIRAVGGGAYLRYLWPHDSGTGFAYMGWGLGLNRLRREALGTGAHSHEMQLSLHLILVGLEKHVMKGRMKGLFEVRWVVGEEEDATALRAAVGIGVNLRK